MKRVLIADELHHSIIPLLKDANLVADYQPLINRNELKDVIKHYEGLIIRSKTIVDKEIFENSPKLEFIGRSGAGLDLIDVAEAKKRNVAIFHAGEGNRISVGEHVLGMILNLFNKITIADQQVRRGFWKREANRGTELYGKTVGIIGCGNNGYETAKRFTAFGCKVLAFDKYKVNYSDSNVIESTMEDIFREADIISLHIPLTGETNRMVNCKYFKNFSKNIYFINAARGEIVVLKDIVEMLKTEKILGACLDVLENEKLQQLIENQDRAFEYLTSSEKVILTPHVAGWTHESYIKLNEVLVEKIKKHFNK